MPTLHSVTDAYDLAATRLTHRKSTTLSECVPLLDIALELIDRGPTDLTIEAIESYRECGSRFRDSSRSPRW